MISTRTAIRATAGTILSVLAFAGIARAADGEVSAPPRDARTMSAVELYMLYQDRSWQWSDGAGRMQSDGRRFTAWSGSGDKFAWAQGRWTVNDDGLMCMVAQWHSASGSGPDRTCFSHKRLGDTIYQRKGPSGSWYVFKHASHVAGDEFNKLVREDLVSGQLEKLGPAKKPSQEAKSNRSKQS